MFLIEIKDKDGRTIGYYCAGKITGLITNRGRIATIVEGTRYPDRASATAAAGAIIGGDPMLMFDIEGPIFVGLYQFAG